MKEKIKILIRDKKLEDWVVKQVRRHKEEVADKGKSDNVKEKKDVEKISFIREASIYTTFRGPHIGGSGRSVWRGRSEKQSNHLSLT